MNTPQELVDQAIKNGYEKIAITDHGSLGGAYHLHSSAKNKIPYIVGIENYCVDELNQTGGKKRIKGKNSHLILLAKNDKGYKSLLKLNYLANKDTEHFYYKPRNTFDEVFENKEGLIVGTACIASVWGRLLKDGKEDEAKLFFKKFVDEFKDDFYAEVHLNELKDSLTQKMYNDYIISWANEFGVPIILASDAHYTTPDMAEIQELSFKLRKDDSKEAGEFFQCHHLFLHTEKDFKKMNLDFNYNYDNSKIEEWMSNSKIIADKCNFRFKEREEITLPRYCFDEYRELRRLSYEGMEKHFGVPVKELPKNYQERLNKELDMYRKKGMARYILILWDIFQFARREDIYFSAGRGSAGGSLVLCSLGIVAWLMDPLLERNDFLFERFISDQRCVDMRIKYY
jgi:DNA polymerase-3 subunit alpha